MSSYRLEIAASGGAAPAGMPGAAKQLSPLDARVLRAVDPWRERTAARIAKLSDCSEDVARGSLRRLRARILIEPDGSRPTGWLRTREGDRILEHQR